MQKISVVWLRRDLRLEDNTALNAALDSGYKVMLVFVFDDLIINQLPANDARINFIYDTLANINQQLINQYNSCLLIKKGKPLDVWQSLTQAYSIANVYCNHDYEPYAIKRDQTIADLLSSKGILLHSTKDQVIFEKNEVLKKDNTPYTVYTPYKNQWLKQFANHHLKVKNIGNPHFLPQQIPFPTKKELGIQASHIKVKPFQLNQLESYANTRNYPAQDGGSYLSVHLRFGTVSIRSIVSQVHQNNPVLLSELIWREFFMQILYHFPKVVNQAFKPKYNAIEWRNNEDEFKLWCQGKTGYPLVDAGMRELNATGYMHNRVRMVVASFLCKDLLIDWQWGEQYFAQQLLDYDLSANNGNWQWAAGTGCDAAPYFRIFNPTEQLKKFDSDFIYVRQWVKDFDELTYPKPMVDHKMARQRCLVAYKTAISNYI